jgi:hypothetical protein
VNQAESGLIVTPASSRLLARRLQYTSCMTRRQRISPVGLGQSAIRSAVIVACSGGALLADPIERDTRTWTRHGDNLTITFSVPETYGSCRNRGLTDVVYTEGVPKHWHLLGRINVGYIRDGEFVITEAVPVDTTGDLALSIVYPPHDKVRPHSNGVLEYHVEPQIELTDAEGRPASFAGGDLERAPGALGPGGQDWDVFCVGATTSSSR